MECPTCGVDNPPEAIICECGYGLKIDEKNEARPNPKQLVFKSNEAAFQYACQFLNTSLDNENPVLGIVLEQKSGTNEYCIKLSNPDDPSVPTVSVSELIQNEQLEHLCPYTEPLDRVPPLKKGDLVMCIVPAELTGTGAAGAMIIAKMKSIYDMDAGGWVIDKG